MSCSTSTRLHPIAALRALRNLKRSGGDMRQGVVLMDALCGKTWMRQLVRFRQTETGCAVLAERRRLLDRLNERELLAGLPPGTLGRAYYEFMTSEKLSAQSLVDASQVAGMPMPSEDMTLFRERIREMHDLLHVVTGYDRDPLGEFCLIAFSYALTELKGFGVIAIWGAQRLARRLGGAPVRRAVFEGYRHGRRAKWLPAADWEALLPQPLAAIRARYRIAEPGFYHRVLTVTRGREAAKTRARPAAT
jgi:ubiquinone biosynthesis protein COQ4